MHKRQATLELQLHTLVFFKNCSDLVLLGGRRFNIRGALQRGLELTDDIDYCEPISSWGCEIGLRIYDDIKKCFEFCPKAEERCVHCGRSYKDLLENVIDRLTYNIRLLNIEIREGRCGPVVVYLEPSERWK